MSARGTHRRQFAGETGWTSDQVVTALERHYRAPEYAFLTAVRNATGWARTTRTADVLVMSLWPSRGLELLGFEVKVSRNDWRREKKNPEKAEEIAARCDRWYVAAPVGVIPVEEVPVKWGLLECDAQRVRQVKPADKLKAQAWDRPFLAALFRRIGEDMVPRAGVEERIAADAAGRAADQQQRQADAVKIAQRDLEELRTRIRAFEEVSGIGIGDRWLHPEKIGAAVRAVLNGSAQRARDELQRLRACLVRITAEIDEDLATQDVPEDGARATG